MATRIGIRSKLIILLLATTIGSILIVGWMGYYNAKKALEAAALNQLTSLREAKAQQVRDDIETARQQAIAMAATPTTAKALLEFRRGFAQQAQMPLPPEWDAALKKYYTEEFLPEVAKRTGTAATLESCLPRTSAGRRLQYRYLVSAPGTYLTKGVSNVASDGSIYGNAFARYNPLIREFAKRFGYEDIQLVDAQSRAIVYSSQRTAEFTSNLKFGPYANTQLASLVNRILRMPDKNTVMATDFERYRPSLDAATAFVGAPIFEGDTPVGVLVLQFPIDRLNRVMACNYEWEKQGLGKTGEVFLVGSDNLMRSRSRFMVTDPKQFIKDMRANGVQESVLDSIERHDNVILSLPVRTHAVMTALSGREDRQVYRDYRGNQALGSAAPFDIGDLRWAIVAKMDAAEAFKPATDFTKRLLMVSTGLILLFTALVSGLAQLFIRPIMQLIEGAKRVSEGELGTEVTVTSRDELSDLADSFNTMTRSLRAQHQELEAKVKENEALLLNILPGPVAERRKGGDSLAPELYSDVTVMFADIEGFNDLSQEREAEQAVELLNELVGAFDEAAERLGVEKVKTISSSYMAVCGLSVRRPDHTARLLEFAEELPRIVRAFNQRHGVNLGVDVGMNAGPVIGGIIGRDKFIYDLWGDTVTIARTIRSAEGTYNIRVTETVKERLADTHTFASAGDVEVRGRGPVAVWTLTA